MHIVSPRNTHGFTNLELRAIRACNFDPDDAMSAFNRFAARDSPEVNLAKIQADKYWTHSNGSKERVLCTHFVIFQMESLEEDPAKIEKLREELLISRAIMASSFPLQRYKRAQGKYERRVSHAALEIISRRS